MSKAIIVLAVVLVAGCSSHDDSPEKNSDTAQPREPGATLKGLVVDESGAAIANARLTTDPHGYEALSHKDGSFSISRLPVETYRLIGAATGHGVGEEAEITVESGETVSTTITLPVLPPAGFVEVEVLGPDGSPLQQASISDGFGQIVTTGVDGQATLLGLAGQTVEVQVSATGLWSRTIEQVTVGAYGGVQLAVQLSGRPPANAYEMGDESCTLCHPTETANHSNSPHSNTLPQAVESPLLDWFEAGRIIDLGVGTATLGIDGDMPVVTIEGNKSRSFQVNGLVGDADEASVPYTEMVDQAFALPIAWVAGRPEFGDWPEAAEKIVAYQVDTWLNDKGDFTFKKNEQPHPSLSAEARCFGCHATGFTLNERSDGGVEFTPASGADSRWTTNKVGCERCHGPASAHISATSDYALYITNPSLLDPNRANEVCGQCHSGVNGLDNTLPYAWHSTDGLFRPGASLADFAVSTAETWPNNTAAGPHQQGDELLDSPHGPSGAYTLRCFDCHDPHDSTKEQSLRLDHGDNSLCASCHLALSFAGDKDDLEDHPQHYFGHDPDGTSQIGRCTGCHMARTAASIEFNQNTGAGNLASHGFVVVPPQDTVDVFDALGVDVLAPGEFPLHSCVECHEYNLWRKTEAGSSFAGVTGDPALVETHRAHQLSYEAKFP